MVDAADNHEILRVSPAQAVGQAVGVVTEACYRLTVLSSSSLSVPDGFATSTADSTSVVTLKARGAGVSAAGVPAGLASSAFSTVYVNTVMPLGPPVNARLRCPGTPASCCSGRDASPSFPTRRRQPSKIWFTLSFGSGSACWKVRSTVVVIRECDSQALRIDPCAICYGVRCSRFCQLLQ